MSDKLNQGMIKNFNWHWDHQQGAVFLKKDEIYAHRKNLAEFFYRAGHASRDEYVREMEALLWKVESVLNTILRQKETFSTMYAEPLLTEVENWRNRAALGANGMTEGLEILKGDL